MEQLRFGLLGPLEVTGPAGPVPVRGPKQRALLAALGLDAGRFVPVDVLRRTLWDDDPPDSAVAQLQTRVWRLRRLLGGDGLIDTEPDGGGYRITVPPGDLDVAAATADALESLA